MRAESARAEFKRSVNVACEGGSLENSQPMTLHHSQPLQLAWGEGGVSGGGGDAPQ